MRIGFFDVVFFLTFKGLNIEVSTPLDQMVVLLIPQPLSSSMIFLVGVKTLCAFL